MLQNNSFPKTKYNTKYDCLPRLPTKSGAQLDHLPFNGIIPLFQVT